MKKKDRKNNYLFYDFIKVTAAIPGLLWLRPKKIYATEKAKEKIKRTEIVCCHVCYLLYNKFDKFNCFKIFVAIHLDC